MSTAKEKIKKIFRGDSKAEEVDVFERIKELEYECMLMQRYITNENREVDKDLIKNFSLLSIEIRKLNNKEQLSADECSDLYNKVLEIHNEFSVLTKPANPVSIKFTEYSKGIFLARNRIVNYMIGLTIFFLILYILFKVTLNEESNLASLLFVFSASGLGAGFYTLTTVRRYIITRTFNPRYIPTYIIRFVLGVTAGIILALFLKDVMNSEEYNFSVELLALVGGFSADAVSIILQRIADVLITIFKGSGKNNL